uniref:Uncharacterized protein n=1 Tax=Glycine max TaxID=3847 RepID=C6T6S0_SOYBN|nr:unknown [Glycine max]
MGRSPCCSHEELRKGAWTVQEDQKLIAYIQKHGTGSWRTLPQKAGLQRCGKSCRLRWFNYLRPDIKRGKLSQEEEQTIIKLQAVLGNRWSSIAKHLPKRTDNEIKNYWNSYLRKQFEKNAGDSSSPKPISSDSSPESNPMTCAWFH